MARVTDESILGALLSAGSIRSAAALAGCCPDTVRKRLQNPDFAQRWRAAKDAQLQEVFTALKNRLIAAADTLAEVMNDTENPATVRVTAADALLRHGLKYAETAEIMPRLAALEDAQRGRK